MQKKFQFLVNDNDGKIPEGVIFVLKVNNVLTTCHQKNTSSTIPGIHFAVLTSTFVYRIKFPRTSRIFSDFLFFYLQILRHHTPFERILCFSVLHATSDARHRSSWSSSMICMEFNKAEDTQIEDLLHKQMARAYVVHWKYNFLLWQEMSWKNGRKLVALAKLPLK